MRTEGPGIDKEIAHYEGLVFATAQRYVALVEEDLEDLQQLLRIKIWTAIRHYDPARSRMSRDRFVFMVVRNMTKDWMKRRRRGELSIEAITNAETESGRLETRDSFEEQYLSSSHEDVYSEVEAELPLIPSTLTRLERKVLCLLYSDYRQSEVARELRIEKREVERAVRAIRTKFADWKPSEVSEPERIAA